MINLFSGELKLHAPGFEAWPKHMQLEYILLASERGRTDLDLHYATGVPERSIRNIRVLGCAPFALSYSDIKVLEEDAPIHPHMASGPKRLDGRVR
jgi:hypothetical protein